MATQKKIDTVKSLTEKLSQAKSIVLTDYQGFTHKELETLRKNLKKVAGEFMITKNTLLKRALGDQNIFTKDHLQGATGTLVAYEDEVSPIKELLGFFKTAAKGKIKAGLLSKSLLSAEDTEKLALLPNRDTLLSMLVGQLQAPIYGLHNALSWNTKKLVWTLDAVKNNKSS